MKKSIYLIAAIAAGLSAYAADSNSVTVDGWTLNYETHNQLNYLTSASGSGALNLTDNAGINIITPGAFKGNANLTSISIPPSVSAFTNIPEVVTLVDQTITGQGQGTVQNFPASVPAGYSFSMSVRFKITGEKVNDSYNSYVGEWGSALLATGQNNTNASNYTGGFQLWLCSNDHDGNGMIRVTFAGTNVNGRYDFTGHNALEDGEFTVNMEYDYDTKESVWYVTYKDGTTSEPFKRQNQTFNTISYLCTNIYEGVQTDAVFTRMVSTANSDPFAGCLNLENITVSDDNVYFSTSDNGYLMDDGNILSVPYSTLFDKYVNLTATSGSNSLLDNCWVDTDGKILVGSNRVCTGGSAAQNPGRALFMLRKSGGNTMIEDMNASFNTGAIGQADSTPRGWIGGSGTNNSTVDITFMQQWGSTFTISCQGGSTEPIFAITHSGGSNVSATGSYQNGATLYIRPVSEFTATSSDDADYVAMCLPVAVNLPEGKCFFVNKVENGNANRMQLKGKIPAGTPFFAIQGTTIPMESGDVTVEDNSTNMLHGFCQNVNLATTYAANNIYTLSGASLAQLASKSLTGGNVFLVEPSDGDWDEQLTFSTEVSTGITAIEATDATETSVYDLRGRKVTRPAHGVYIINGKKIRL